MRTQSARSLVYLAAGFGLLASLFAAAETLSAALAGACTVNGFVSCAAVANSGRTATLGIPDYAWGIGGFVAILIVAGVAERRAGDPKWGIALAALTGSGTALSLYFLYVELAEIHAFCLVCATAYLTGWIAFAGALVLRRAPASPEAEPSAPESSGPA